MYHTKTNTHTKTGFGHRFIVCQPIEGDQEMFINKRIQSAKGWIHVDFSCTLTSTKRLD